MNNLTPLASSPAALQNPSPHRDPTGAAACAPAHQQHHAPQLSHSLSPLVSEFQAAAVVSGDSNAAFYASRFGGGLPLDGLGGNGTGPVVDQTAALASFDNGEPLPLIAPAQQAGLNFPETRHPQDDGQFAMLPIHHREPSFSQPQPETQTPAPDPQPADQAEKFKLIPNPPNLQEWRQRLFDVDDTIVLSQDQYGRILSHSSSQVPMASYSC
jgi:hypothetical protein